MVSDCKFCFQNTELPFDVMEGENREQTASPLTDPRVGFMLLSVYHAL